LDDGLFELILIKNPMTTSDLSNIISGLFSSDFSSDVFEYVKTTRVRIEFEEPIYWSLDGEKVEGDRILDIQDLHRALTLMR
ncbi:MAG: diacylglycerol kinase family lipid kinase, partial [Firmicutes bacterium]|nr:diacylglycerol kinase family lipid kinase [Bacillota bacterium]